MEQPSTRIPQRKARRAAPVPRPAAPVGPPGPAGGGAAVHRARSGAAVPPLRRALDRLPRPRLTGLGSGLLATVGMLAAGAADASLFGASPGFYGVCFVVCCAVCALWVRPADLVTAPVAAPIAFAVGAVPLDEGAPGFGGQVMGLVTVLALHAGWLYAGTLLAALLAFVRRIVVLRVRRRERQRRRPSRPPRSPRCSPVEQARSRR
ncbi:DUF6542 domain-containing protein [Streptomyces gamaensis]|uniref:DUF6542 domain-containing protein n=1 Tax=Streptomyces gamaensis TaxID=1763542 RepID=A0ABW0YQR0_9ACTN